MKCLNYLVLLHDNNLTGVVPEEICNRTFFKLQFLQADCAVEIECECCKCCADGSVRCLKTMLTASSLKILQRVIMSGTR